MKRQRDWRSRLQHWAADQVGKPFAWGTTDCASLARAALIEMFGPTLTPLLPEWDSLRGAVAVLRDRRSITAVLEELGAVPTSVPFMRAGDMVVVAEPDEESGHEAVSVCVDGQQCVTSTRAGVELTIAEPSSRVYSLWVVAE